MTVKHMKWWGWGEEGIAFEHRDKPALAPFVRKVIGIDLHSPPLSVPDFDRLEVPPSALKGTLQADLEAAVGPDSVIVEPKDRVVHTYGKSLRDLVRLRQGDLGRVPDAVVYPSDEAQVAAVLNAALAADAVVIAFGGGTNIAGSLEAPRGEQRPVISVDLGRLHRVLELDPVSQLARIEAGALGPDLEAQLNASGWTLGHFPDSFNHSSLGGWIATRSSGMQSDKYGDISGITKAVRLVSPAGVLHTRAVPATSTGPSVREMVLGSEGRLGIITEATVQVHRVPEQRQILGYFFPDWGRGLSAMAELAASDLSPSVTRISDANETAFSLATRKRSTLASRLVSAGMKQYLQRRRGLDLDRLCLSFIGYEGSAARVRAQRKGVGAIVARHGGLCIGSGPGALYDQKKFDTPYIRDFLLDRGALADVSETAAAWSKLPELYSGVIAEATDAFRAIGVQGFIMCHMAHSYHSGACLYFTFAFKPAAGAPPLDQYDAVKAAVQGAFLRHGGTLSHHHAVGAEHARWLAEDLSPAGAAMVTALFDGVDPGHNLNPGKIV